MPTDANRQFLDFERPIKDLIDEIASMKNRQEKTKLDLSDTILKLEQGILTKRKEITDWNIVLPRPRFHCILVYAEKH